jgi:hypothetical protein
MKIEQRATRRRSTRRKESRRKESRRKESRRKESRRKESRRKESRRSKRLGCSNKNNIVIKSFPENNEILDNAIKECDYSIIKFYMNGCPHCDNIKEMWKELGKNKELKNHDCKLGIFEVEVSNYTNPIDKKYIDPSQGVPHIICVNKDGNVVDTFKDNERTILTMTNFVKSAIKQKK